MNRQSKHSLFTKILFVFLSLVFSVTNSVSQDSLEYYIQEGLSKNLIVKQRSVSYKIAVNSLKIAKSYFLPSVDFLGDYTTGEGGRELSFPVGDLLNPVYSTLNELTQTNSFPQIGNFKQNFFPTRQYDVRMRLSMPLLNTDLFINRDIQEEKVKIEEYQIDLYKRELIRDIKEAYYSYLLSLKVLEINENAKQLAIEAKRVNQSLFDNGKGLSVYVLRSESEIENINANISESESRINAAMKYFNFLLNRSPDSPISTSINVDSLLEISVNTFKPGSREELNILKKEMEINQSVTKLNKLYWVPKINTFLDLGFQDINWDVNSNSKYYLFGVQMQIPIFDGLRSSFKIQESKLNELNTELNYKYANNQINLSKDVSLNNITAAREKYAASLKGFEAASAYNRLIEKGFKEGANTFIETIDARFQKRQSEIQISISKFQVLTELARYERETASYKLK